MPWARDTARSLTPPDRWPAETKPSAPGRRRTSACSVDSSAAVTAGTITSSRSTRDRATNCARPLSGSGSTGTTGQSAPPNSPHDTPGSESTSRRSSYDTWLTGFEGWAMTATPSPAQRNASISSPASVAACRSIASISRPITARSARFAKTSAIASREVRASTEMAADGYPASNASAVARTSVATSGSAAMRRTPLVSVSSRRSRYGASGSQPVAAKASRRTRRSRVDPCPERDAGSLNDDLAVVNVGGSLRPGASAARWRDGASTSKVPARGGRVSPCT